MKQYLIFILILPLLSSCSIFGVTNELEGQASYYSSSLDGKKTASGELLDNSAYTASHKSLPFGTIVKVTMLKNGKSVVVRINDRGPFKRGRVIDLTQAAAKKIGLYRYGVAKVKLEILSKP